MEFPVIIILYIQNLKLDYTNSITLNLVYSSLDNTKSETIYQVKFGTKILIPFQISNSLLISLPIHYDVGIFRPTQQNRLI